MSTQTYTVTGMTCGHCVASVTEEVSELPGVSDVSVDLESGRLTVTAEPPVGDDQVRAAVEEAGYAVAG
jgi:copper ion binding protein